VTVRSGSAAVTRHALLIDGDLRSKSGSLATLAAMRPAS
jgi:hypothetical protein